MNSDNDRCPICNNIDGGSYQITEHNLGLVSCSICGDYQIDINGQNRLSAGKLVIDQKVKTITPIDRALISHRTRLANESRRHDISINDDSLCEIIENYRLPSPREQAINLVRFIGDKVSQTGEDIKAPPEYIHAIIGAPRLKAAYDLANELQTKGWLKLNPKGGSGTIGKDQVPVSVPTNINLTLDGWEQYEAEQRGKFAGNYGFIAMQFNEPELETFVDTVIRPEIQDKLSCRLEDLRDKSKAGVIDNLMRVAIRDAKFVIADLTHGNNGAYWEAGYAEGLGKPVIYLCEKEKFEKSKEDGGGTHFDTNHCTTIPWSKAWSKDDEEYFRKKLIATIQRSLEM